MKREPGLWGRALYIRSRPGVVSLPRSLLVPIHQKKRVKSHFVWEKKKLFSIFFLSFSQFFALSNTHTLSFFIASRSLSLSISLSLTLHNSFTLLPVLIYTYTSGQFTVPKGYKSRLKWPRNGPINSQESGCVWRLKVYPQFQSSFGTGCPHTELCV